MLDLGQPGSILITFGLVFVFGLLRGAWNEWCDWRAGRRCVEYHKVNGYRIKTWRENGEWFARRED